MKLLSFFLLLVSPLIVFAQELTINKVSYELTDILENSKKNSRDSIIEKGKVEIYTLKNNSKSNYIVFITKNKYTNLSIRNKINYFYYTPTPGRTGLPLYEIAWSPDTYGGKTYGKSHIYLTHFIKCIKPDESFTIVCTYRSNYIDDNFQPRITTCTYEEFTNVIGKSDMDNLLSKGFFYPYDTFGVPL